MVPNPVVSNVVPSVLFLILAGVAVGPKGVSIVTVDAFGDALTTVVGISVAIILFPSTTGERFETNEKLFMSFVGLRGIIPASVATLFAIQLQTPEAPSNPDGPNVLAGTVFLVILLTVVFGGGFARQIAEKLEVIPMRVPVIGNGRVGTEIVDQLEKRGENVVIIEHRESTAEDLPNQGYSVDNGDRTNSETLRKAGAERSEVVVQEIEATDESLVGNTVGDVSESLPARCMIALVSRGNENTVPEDSQERQYGDHLTLLGRTDAVHKAISQLRPHD